MLLPTTGKYYVEGLAFINNGVGNNSHLGVLDTAVFPSTNRHSTPTYSFSTGEGFDGIYVSLFNDNAQPVSDGVLGAAEGSLTGTTVLAMLAVDIDNGKVWAGYDGTWLNSGDPAAGTNEIASRTFSSTDAIAVGTSYTGTNDQGMFANFGQDSSFAGNKTAQGNTDDNGVGDFYYAPPSGYLALCTANLPDPVIDPNKDDVPEDYFTTVLTTGDGTNATISGFGFQPDFLWHKSRSTSNNHQLMDLIRVDGSGNPTNLVSNSTNAGGTNGVVTFTSDGYTHLNGSSNNFYGSGVTYVDWAWKAGNSTSSNTDGSITSTVSVNQEAGFSIVSWTATGANATVGHGLGVAPAMVIIKSRSGVRNWPVYHKVTTALNEIYLNLTGAAARVAGTPTIWQDTNPTSTVFSIGTGSDVNFSGDNMIAYCFAEVEGYSKFGSYTGNGSTDGPFVYCGFRPAFVMVKRTDSTGDWSIWDSAREPENFVGARVYANTSGAEINAGADLLDLTSNGFKLRNGSASFNASGGTYIFAAFSEMPFKYSNAR
jgi:hypothetical protein